MSYYVYIIESLSLQQWYIGYSTDLERRLEGHNSGLINPRENVGLGNLSLSGSLNVKGMLWYSSDTSRKLVIRFMF
jgi:hypothetical protein